MCDNSDKERMAQAAVLRAQNRAQNKVNLYIPMYIYVLQGIYALDKLGTFVDVVSMFSSRMFLQGVLIM